MGQAMEIVFPEGVATRPLSELIPYVRNARTHTSTQVEQIASSMIEFGFTNPVLVAPDGTIIAGHGRVLAAERLGLTDVPVIVLGHLTDAQRKAYVLADNQLALNGGWDLDLLARELRDLQAVGYDLDLTGFADVQVNELLASLEAELPGDAEGNTLATPAGSGSDPLANPEAVSNVAPPEPVPAKAAPEDFPEFGDDIPVEHECPSCGYRWSGSTKPKADATDDLAG